MAVRQGWCSNAKGKDRTVQSMFQLKMTSQHRSKRIRTLSWVFVRMSWKEHRCWPGWTRIDLDLCFSIPVFFPSGHTCLTFPPLLWRESERDGGRERGGGRERNREKGGREGERGWFGDLGGRKLKQQTSNIPRLSSVHTWCARKVIHSGRDKNSTPLSEEELSYMYVSTQ